MFAALVNTDLTFGLKEAVKSWGTEQGKDQFGMFKRTLSRDKIIDIVEGDKTAGMYVSDDDSLLRYAYKQASIARHAPTFDIRHMQVVPQGDTWYYQSMLDVISLYKVQLILLGHAVQRWWRCI